MVNEKLRLSICVFVVEEVFRVGAHIRRTILKKSSPITQLLHEEFAAEPPQEED